MGMNGYGGGMGGYGVPHAPAPGYGMPPPGPGGSPDMSLHPALLNLVAAQMQQQTPQAQSECRIFGRRAESRANASLV